MNLEAALETFIAEARELLEAMEQALLSMHAPAHGQDHEALAAVFRAAHTIKGSAGLFGLEPIVAFTHKVEHLLDGLRDGSQVLDDALIVLLLSCCDHLRVAVHALDGGAEADPQLAAALMAQLDHHGASAAALPASTAPAAEATAVQRWHLSLRFGADVLRYGLDPLSFLRFLGQLGNIAACTTIAHGLPEAASMDPETCYLGFEVAFDSGAGRAAIAAVFDFIASEAQIRILGPDASAADYEALLASLPEPRPYLCSALARCGIALPAPAEGAAATAALPGADAVSAARPAIAAEPRPGQDTRSIRIDAAKLDQLIDLVGELIIEGATTSLIAQGIRSAQLQESASRLGQLVQAVRDQALHLRMVKIGPTLSRFQRVVHDVSRELGKNIVLDISGEDTELDKTVIEKIGDPLLHLVRNAIDHGIEAAPLRRARGKPVEGTVRLHAYHDAGSIVIEVADDGGGLPRERILAKGRERGLIGPDQTPSDHDLLQLVFAPGFSTAEQVTNLSGRGVGMDVVKRNITALRGSIEIASVEGQGTTVRVRLPLTLAIIDGFLVGVGNAVFVLPLDMVEECIEFAEAPDQHYCDLRGNVLPFVRLRDFFQLTGAPPRRASIVVLKCQGQQFGLVVDSLLGQFQTVIKPLSAHFRQVRCISGSTILGSGEVALILDVPALLHSIANPVAAA